MADFANSSMSQNSPEFEPRVQRLLGLWDVIAQSRSSVEGLQVMASINALPAQVRPAAVRYQRWIGMNLSLVDSIEHFRDQGMRKLAEFAPKDETHWRELVGFAFAFGVQLGGWNVVIVDNPEIDNLYDMRRDTFQRNYFAAKASAGFVSAEDVAKAADVMRGTVMAIERHGVVPRRETLDRLASVFGLSKRPDFFRGLEDVRGWECLFEE